MHYNILVVHSSDDSAFAQQTRNHTGIFVSQAATGAYFDVYVAAEIHAQLTPSALNALAMSLVAMQQQKPLGELREDFLQRCFRFGVRDYASITNCYGPIFGREQTRSLNDDLGSIFGTNLALRLICNVRRKFRKPLTAA